MSNPAYIQPGLAFLRSDRATTSFLANLDIPEQEFLLTIGDEYWIPTDIVSIRRVLNTLIHGSTRFFGYPDLTISAEYIAMIVCTFVHPVNQRVAAFQFTSNLPSNKNIIQQDDTGGSIIERSITPDKLAAMIHDWTSAVTAEEVLILQKKLVKVIQKSKAMPTLQKK